MELFNPKNLNFDFGKHFKLFGICSLAVSILSLVLMYKPGFNFGIDFSGGLEARISFKEPIAVNELRGALESKIQNLSIVSFAEQGKNEYLIKGRSESSGELSNILTSALTEKYGNEGDKWVKGQVDVVGPTVGAELGKAAIWSLIYACILITIYMYWRFDARFSPGALLGIFHDLLLTAGFLAITGIEFTTTIVAALLTLAGYSINDTVVVYDRIREVEAKLPGRSKLAIANEALNSTLSRTLMTSTTTIVSCLVLFFLAGKEISDFALTLIFGIFVGTYSSVFVAAPLYVWTDNFFNKKPDSLSGPLKPKNAKS